MKQMVVFYVYSFCCDMVGIFHHALSYLIVQHAMCLDNVSRPRTNSLSILAFTLTGSSVHYIFVCHLYVIDHVITVSNLQDCTLITVVSVSLSVICGLSMGSPCIVSAFHMHVNQVYSRIEWYFYRPITAIYNK